MAACGDSTAAAGEEFPKAQRMLHEAINELVVSERMFVQDLNILVREFYERLRDRELVTPKQLKTLFCNAPILLQYAEMMLSQVCPRRMVECGG